MTAQSLLNTLQRRGIHLRPDGDGVIVRPASRLTDADREAIRRCKAEILRVLTAGNAERTGGTSRTPAARRTARNDPAALLTLLDRIEATWKPGEWLAYRDADGRLVIAKYAGTSPDHRVNIWLADGALRALPAETIALDWCPDFADIFEQGLTVMLGAGVPEDVARERAERCTREYLVRRKGGAA